MSENAVQASFNSGEWAPTLNARVDLQKYRSGAALLLNWFVDYRGGASTRPGTKYCLQAYKGNKIVRLIPFQASFNSGYALEFGDGYIRPFFQGSPLLRVPNTVTAATVANPAVFTFSSVPYVIGDWVLARGFTGNWAILNGNYYIILSASSTQITLTDLQGNNFNSSALGAWPGGGTFSRVFVLQSPYAAADLALLKFAQNISSMVICHPNYAPQVLTLIGDPAVLTTPWTISPILFGSTVSAPTGVAVTTTLSSGSVNYGYIVTAVDSMGQESGPSSIANLASKTDLRTVAGTNHIAWTGVTGAASYNVYKTTVSYTGIPPVGMPYGFIGNTTSLAFDDSNVSPDYSQTPPVAQNPFQGAGLQSVTITAAGTYTSVPTATVDSAPSGGQTATLQPILGVTAVTLTVGIPSSVVGDPVTITGITGPTFTVSTVSLGVGVGLTVVNPGAVTSGSVSTSGLQFVNLRTGTTGTGNITWGVIQLNITNAGAGYTSIPNIAFSSGSAAATAILAPTSAGNPSVPGFFQQRLVLAAPLTAPQTFYMSQPGYYYNFNVSNPILPDDSISGTLVSGVSSTIKSMVPVPAGLLMFTDRYSWIVNGGTGTGSAVSPSSIVANAQSFNGISDVPPIFANFDVLYVQAKGSVIRDSNYNIYANVYTGTDISLLASHLFYGHFVSEWAFAEEPFKLVQTIRDDGTLLTLTFLKEQEFIGWTHSTTQGSFNSVCVVTETTSEGASDETYFVVHRNVNGNLYRYIERLADRQFPNGIVDAWCVDAGIQYNGSPATTFTGAMHLAGLTCTGLADGIKITPFVMPTSGTFTLPTAASKVTVGLPFTCDLQTLALDLGEPTIQGKVKKIVGVDVRVADTLGLLIGSSFNNLVPMADLIRGNVSTMLTGQDSQIITDLTTGDSFERLDPTYTIPGQYCIRQSDPYPATVLGVFPSIVVGDTK